jgi:hypothetical protein
MAHTAPKPWTFIASCCRSGRTRRLAGCAPYPTILPAFCPQTTKWAASYDTAEEADAFGYPGGKVSFAYGNGERDLAYTLAAILHKYGRHT